MHHRAICADALGEPEAAEIWLRKAIRQGAASDFHTEEGMGTYQTWYTLGRLLEGKADLEGAVDAYVETVRAKSVWCRHYIAYFESCGYRGRRHRFRR